MDGLEDPPTGFEPPLGASGPRIVRDNTADDAGVSLDRIKFDTEASEVHAILQFPYGAGTGRNPVNWTDGAVPDVTAAEFHKGRKTNFVGWVLENFGWLKLQQIIWDFYDAGIIVGASGSMTNWEAPENSTMAGDTLDASDFYEYVYAVANGDIEDRPTAQNLLGLLALQRGAINTQVGGVERQISFVNDTSWSDSTYDMTVFKFRDDNVDGQWTNDGFGCFITCAKRDDFLDAYKTKPCTVTVTDGGTADVLWSLSGRTKAFATDAQVGANDTVEFLPLGNIVAAVDDNNVDVYIK